MENNDLTSLQKAIYAGDFEKSSSITESILKEGSSAQAILNDGLIKGMEKVGVDFKNGDLFLPEVLLAARAMKSSMTILKPLLIKSGIKSSGKVILGTVNGDIHDIRQESGRYDAGRGRI